VHTPPGTTVEVALVAGQDTVTILVTDDGPGFPPELQETLFERFARGDDSRSRASGSTGLGLAIVRSVVEGHGGTVTAESVPGRTRFTLVLPR
jgi:two-component system OmpR family sensor kinase